MIGFKCGHSLYKIDFYLSITTYKVFIFKNLPLLCKQNQNSFANSIIQTSHYPYTIKKLSIKLFATSCTSASAKISIRFR